MSEFDASILLPNDHLQELTAKGELTQLHRGDRYADEGDTFVVDGQEFVITDVTDETLGDITEEDARREGSADLEAYRKRLKRAHKNFEWDDDSETVRHRFEPVDENA
jgi:uncharacterized protein YhfF